MAEVAEKTPVTLTDGRVVGFGKRQKLSKNSTIAEDGTVTSTFDFINGQTRTFTPPAALLSQFIAHGIEAKLGDAIAGESDIEDAVIAFDALLDRLSKGEWTAPRKAGEFAGTSVLIQALVEASGKTVAEIKEFLAPKTQAEKFALRRSDKLRPIIERLEAAKAAGSKSTVDTDSLLGELGISGPAPKASKTA